MSSKEVGQQVSQRRSTGAAAKPSKEYKVAGSPPLLKAASRLACFNLWKLRVGFRNSQLPTNGNKATITLTKCLFLAPNQLEMLETSLFQLPKQYLQLNRLWFSPLCPPLSLSESLLCLC
ncbi:hypothetical protein QVD17_05037 [Tagetes erecta]|uniref:Uncharacterized protein n=1 Tax=Tagetes erecta TaxID=13708 RepID=A0AAD8LHF3_TARER|nr:hypothetical protein QVD17_05037 [Tagetes erecta]